MGYQPVPDPEGFIRVTSSTSNWTHTVTGSAVTNFAIALPSRPPWARAIEGVAEYVVGGSDEYLLVAPNGDATNTKTTGDQSLRGTGSGLAVLDGFGLLICYSSSAPSMQGAFRLELDASAGGVTHFRSLMGAVDSTPTLSRAAQCESIWTTPAAITSLTFKGTSAGGVGVGTRIRLFWRR